MLHLLVHHVTGRLQKVNYVWSLSCLYYKQPLHVMVDGNWYNKFPVLSYTVLIHAVLQPLSEAIHVLRPNDNTRLHSSHIYSRSFSYIEN